MGRHRLPAAPGPARRRPRPRTLAVATALALVGAAGAAAAAGLLPALDGRCADGTVRLRVAASPDVAPLVEETAARARADRVLTDGSCLDVRVTARPSHEVAAGLAAAADPDFEVWIPDSGIWVERARLLPDAVTVTASGEVAASPVVLAAAPAAAGALGGSGTAHTWAELAAAGLRDPRLRTGAADPLHSASTLLALGRIAASAGRLGPDGDAVVAGAAKQLAQRTSASDTRVLATLPRNGSDAEQTDPRRNQSLILSEQAAFRHHSRPGATPLDLYYPADGAPVLDYPYTLVDERRLDLTHSRAALRLLRLLGDEEGRRALARHGFRDRRATPTAGVVKTAGGSDPRHAAAVLAEPPTGREVQQILALWTITVQNARLLTVVDASGSMGTQVPGHRGRTRMEITRDSLLQGLAGFTPQDEIGLWTFATRLDGDRDHRELVPARPLGETAEDGSTRRQRLTAAFEALAPVPDGGTGLHDTVLAAYRAGRDSYVPGTFNAVVVVTDGVNEDPGSPDRAAVVARLRELADPQRPVPLIALAIGPRADLAELGPIARATGGAAYRVSDPAQIHTVILKAITAVGRG
ncbi:substrate-binding and VWA domain-containing protein [Streptomyces bambusae]|uniref:substrate-binding domain-containing protein n=1 Tax=Streptomyces bambusae TaxID=1550616 RepID=UPI001CFCFCE7|nr:substrate-binding domain-containing protein [Streptomyces bambusae]MCB5168702.1 substrate-binding and VWA domain-containing protein [Streptomyces bambusae]